MVNWKEYYRREAELVKKFLKAEFKRDPDREDYKRASIVKKIDTNIIHIYIDNKFVAEEML